VLSTGTYLDSLRFRVTSASAWWRSGLGRRTVLGEHGTSQVTLWSSARVADRPAAGCVGGTRSPNMTFAVQSSAMCGTPKYAIIEGNGPAEYGIGMVSARIAEIVVRDERADHPDAVLHPAYGVTLSGPKLLGARAAPTNPGTRNVDEERQSIAT